MRNKNLKTRHLHQIKKRGEREYEVHRENVRFAILRNTIIIVLDFGMSVNCKRREIFGR